MATSSIVSADAVYSLAELYQEEEPRPAGRPRKFAALDVPRWVQEHLPGIEVVREKTWNGAAIYELSECPFDGAHKAPDSMIMQQPSGALGFKCFHNSCQAYGWKELREKFDPRGNFETPQRKRKAKRTREEIEEDIFAITQDTGLPTIELGDRQLRDVEDECLDAIMAAGKDDPLMYIRGDRLVRITEDSKGNPKIDTLTSEAIPTMLTRAANFVRTTGEATTGVFPPPDLARAVVNRGRWPFPPLHGVVEIPVLREDGTILDAPGYDRASGLYYIPSGPAPSIKTHPTKQDGQDAARFIIDILSDFPVQDDCSRDNAIGTLLTTTVKEYVGLAPLALIDAPTQGTGKGKLAQLVSIVATGRELPVSTEVRDDDEWRKQITSTLLADRPVVIIDNVEKTLSSPQLAAVLTSSEWSDRLLGKSETLRLYARAMWIATGNNIRLGGDIPRRSYWIRLNANMARPWTRDPRGFKRELPGWALEHRAEIVAALLTMARAWFLAGRPEWSGRPLGSFEKWSKVVGGILEFCGCTRFLKNLEDLYEQSDDEPAQWNEFIGDAFEVFMEEKYTERGYQFPSEDNTPEGNNFWAKRKNNNPDNLERSTPPFTVKRLVDLICAGSAKNVHDGGNFYKPRKIITVPDALGDPKDRTFTRRISHALRRRKDQIFDTAQGLVQLRSEIPDTHKKIQRWSLCSVSSAGLAGSAVSTPPLAYAEKLNSEVQSMYKGINYKSHIEPGETNHANPAKPADDEKALLIDFDDDPDERAAIQEEGNTKRSAEARSSE